MERVRSRCGYIHGIEVDPEGTRGGLCLAWRNEISVTLQSFSKRYVDVMIDDSEVRGKWRFTGFYGSPYTQDRDKFGAMLRNLYTDRGVANGEWLNLFAEARISYLVHSFSDHCPLLINTGKVDKLLNKKLFKFEAWWIMEESFVQEVKNIWESSSGNLLEKLDTLKESLVRWAGRIRIARRGHKDLLMAKLSELEEANRDDDNLAEMIDIKIQLNLEFDKDEHYWE
ncbi:uncharacterized protein LOC108451493 [Gossypium arboreum]|uniref:uncharacterized protein LOC108451493 n=1 Tax=Gossypium arboreum TaxID=29729 RepID=UPI0008196F71|nr:uncharacterized protein LOC108451493 [Gossypium arboreum]